MRVDTAQPNWRDDLRDFKTWQAQDVFGVTAGCMDSMVNHYTAEKENAQQIRILQEECRGLGQIMLRLFTPIF